MSVYAQYLHLANAGEAPTVNDDTVESMHFFRAYPTCNLSYERQIKHQQFQTDQQVNCPYAFILVTIS